MSFYIGFQYCEINGITEKKRVITLVLDSPKVNKDKDNSFFLEHGGNSNYLENVADILKTLHTGIELNESLMEALVILYLLEVVTL